MRMTLLLTTAFLLAAPVAAQVSNDPSPDPIADGWAPLVVDYTDFARVPGVGGDAALMTTLIDEPGTQRIFVNDMNGADPRHQLRRTDRHAIRRYERAALGLPHSDAGFGARPPELRLPPAVRAGRDPGLREVLHLGRHRGYGSDRGLPPRTRRARHARHRVARVDRPGRVGRDVRRWTAPRAHAPRAALSEPQRRAARVQLLCSARERRGRHALRGRGGRREWRRPP